MTDRAVETLRQNLERLGILGAYDDVFGRRHEVGDEPLVAVAGTVLGAPGATAGELVGRLGERIEAQDRRRVPPVVVAWVDDASATATVEIPGTGDPSPLRLELEVGRHELGEVVPGERTTVVVAPTRLPQLDPRARRWGVFAPVWSLWDPERPGAHLGSLDRLGRWIHGYGGSLVGTLPMLASYLGSPHDPSPYTPISRRWWNENHIDIGALVERSERRPPQRWDPAAQWRVVRAALGDASEQVRRDGGARLAELQRWVAGHPEVEQYGRFRAMVERTGTGWHAWDAGARAGDLPVGDDDPVAQAFVYAQWVLQGQLRDLAGTLAGRGQDLYLDLSLGANGDGYDTWVAPELFAWGAAAGAPPDEFFTGGQTWGFPPLLPDASRAEGHAYFAECLRTHMDICGMLRIDHVMGLCRLFYVPDGLDATQGAYVRYPLEELLAVVSVEAHRSGCVVVGENLGTVPPEIDEAMARHGMYGIYVGQFAQPDDEDAAFELPTDDELASVNTHDTPTFAGWLAADDAEQRRAMGLLDDEGVAEAVGARRRQIAGLRRWLDAEQVDDQELLAALVAALGASRAPAVLLSVDDLVGTVEPQNVPGTPVDRPNWVVQTDRPVDELLADPVIAEVFAGLEGARRGAPGL